MKPLLKPSAEIVLIPLWLTTSASAMDAAIQKKAFSSVMIKLLPF